MTYGILMFDGYGFRPIELIIGALVGVIGALLSRRNVHRAGRLGAAALHTVVPQIADAEALLLAVGIIGATVMPHAIYLHSGLTQARVPVRDDADAAQAAALLQPRGRHRAGASPASSTWRW